ncbi:Cysteine-rich secretory protein LCCL domain-containing [Echinococcus granulosus]|uniref:Cysteine-rich secretory protein LCCL domain-containing n=1 Tax=Echinococcus granulosus TaxID=6210 RepID=U6IUA6_ECHGR|nr:Cysteine-rich secretory protein LCCL domain-containing [Echinococcus granulosus]EUB57620.1 Cysteine-rich secretory protein LCCL domain-containing [Echinococcus granulosus]CDS15270.1 peptidase inhibitor 16 [Echinococcus granulosus]
MVDQGRFQVALIFGLVVGLVVGCVRAEKPDVMRILTRHQQYRSLTQAADMMKMTWSVNLERIAALVVEKCPKSVEAVRSQTELRDLGANLGSAPYPPPLQDGYPEDIQTSIIDQWGSQRSYYYPDSGCPGHPCDAWWQVVWSNASQVGCSLKVCGTKSIMVCIYNSRANNETDAPFKIGKACSACPYGYSKCEQGMCVAEKNLLIEPEPLPGFLPAAPSTGENDNTEINDSGTDSYGDPDSTSRLTVLLTSSICIFLHSLLV